MVYGRYNELVFMGFINQVITGGHHPVGTSMNENSASMQPNEQIHIAWKICSIWVYGKETWWPRIFHETWENHGKMIGIIFMEKPRSESLKLDEHG